MIGVDLSFVSALSSPVRADMMKSEIDEKVVECEKAGCNYSEIHLYIRYVREISYRRSVKCEKRKNIMTDAENQNNKQCVTDTLGEDSNYLNISTF